MPEFDRAIVLPSSYKSALLPWFAKIPRRSGYVGEQRFGVLNDIRRLDERQVAAGGAAICRAWFAGRIRRCRRMLPKPKLRVDAVQAMATARRFGLVLGVNGATKTGGDAKENTATDTTKNAGGMEKIAGDTTGDATEDTVTHTAITADGAPILALCPGAEYGRAKRWPPDYFAEVAMARFGFG